MGMPVHGQADEHVRAPRGIRKARPADQVSAAPPLSEGSGGGTRPGHLAVNACGSPGVSVGDQE